MMPVGLVMEGGAMRGLFTAGVIDVLMENDIWTDASIGVSAGAAFGCNYKSRQTGRVLRYNLRFCRNPEFCSFRSWIKTGDVYGAEFCYRTLPDKLDIFDTETFAANPAPFYVVCTDVDTGRPVYHECKTAGHHELDWMRASASMPIASRPVELDGYRLLDGGISDSVPLEYFESIGYEKNIVILTQPDTYRKKKSRLFRIADLLLRKYPKLREAMKDRPERYNANIDYVRRREKDGASFVIRPAEPLNVGAIEHRASELQRVYDTGHSLAESLLPALKSWLGTRPDPRTENK